MYRDGRPSLSPASHAGVCFVPPVRAKIEDTHAPLSKPDKPHVNTGTPVIGSPVAAVLAQGLRLCQRSNFNETIVYALALKLEVDSYLVLSVGREFVEGPDSEGLFRTVYWLVLVVFFSLYSFFSACRERP